MYHVDCMPCVPCARHFSLVRTHHSGRTILVEVHPSPVAHPGAIAEPGVDTVVDLAVLDEESIDIFHSLKLKPLHRAVCMKSCGK
mmetsp:Transcript_11431/g.27815  ORF Transcript_11431/g.27815 Transcript_11431/m.27815 type:complete len:85 (+) Transcript_11431:178-432(+)